MMMLPLAVVTLCLSAVLSAPALDPQLDEHWNLWKSWHKKEFHVVRLGISVMKNLNGRSLNASISKEDCVKQKKYIIYDSLSCFYIKEGRGLEENGVGEELEEN